ncbi:MAG: Heavy metal transport/detoxification protein [Candidatus Magasanikbacteria bacterium GW2011_GWC2_37_14]|uniref:Heavy metal transport/detoxification protein n=1 Tax=Candidatus Magasanikbacteria bacterium GW2011_GWC2_37_14 TaxID=1619046 RepID=A0A0G0GBA3_9BACT|nr:MAG: Heavy metal transport/detoxification protein [Candidatus Magasanikbacteria bacterium GW2011_GWC2_37_14]
MKKITIPIKGMHCRSCEILIESGLKKIPGVNKVVVSHKTGSASLFCESDIPASETIRQTIKDAGYDIGRKDKSSWLSKDRNDYINLLKGGSILLVLYIIAKSVGLFTLGVNTQSTSLLVVLVVGLVAGISTCMALVGGLVLSLSARHAELHPEISAKQKFIPHLYFNLGRILGFGFLGGIIGLLGSVVKPSAGTLGLMTIIVGGVMMFLGLKLIEIFPALKDKSFSLPKGIANFFGLNKEQKEYSHKSSFITGALTFFLPCGFTQAMQLFAVSTGSFFQGFLVMGLFALGTAPGLLGVGGLASVFSARGGSTSGGKGQRARVFFAATGLAVIMLGWFNIANGGQIVFQAKATGVVPNSVSDSNGVQEVRMTQSGSGYSPNEFTVEKGKKVKWIINSTNSFTCASSIVMPKYGIDKSLEKGENVIEFVPTETGEIPFSCSMGMYRGKFIVVESGDTALKTSPTAKTVAALPSGGGCGSGGCGGCGGGVKKLIDTTATTAAVNSNEQIIKAQYTLSNDIVPNRFTVKKGVPVKFEVDVKESGQGCMSTIMVPGLYNQAEYLQGGSKIIMTFTPNKTGDFDITCAMGVPRGVISVIN